MTLLRKNKKSSGKATIENRELLEAILKNLDTSQNNNLDATNWQFNDYTISFSLIEELYKTHPSWHKEHNIDLVWLAKTIFLHSIQHMKGASHIRHKLDSIIKTLYFLADRNIKYISSNELEDYLSFILMHSIYDNKLVKKLSILSFHTFSAGIDSRAWVKIIKIKNLPEIGFSFGFSEVKFLKTLKSTIDNLSAGDLTFTDWKNGGSFNHLTLDYGRYYVEHCVGFFQSHIGLATAIQQTLNQAELIVKNAEVLVNKKNLNTYVKPIIGHFIAGKEINDLSPKMRGKYSVNWLNKLQISTKKIFKEHLLIIRASEAFSNNTEIIKLKCKLGLDENNEHYDGWLRSLVEIRLTQFTPNINSQILQLRLSEAECLLNLIGNKLDINIVNAAIEQTFKEITQDLDSSISLPLLSYFKEIGIQEKASKSTYVNNFIRLVEAAGIIKVVALTGWRESEFGFSLENLRNFQNKDILDQLANPVRHEIHWIVPKTNGKTKIAREITHETYETAIKLAQLNMAKHSSPCLYSYSSQAVNPNMSSEVIKRIISSLWVNFVKYYKPFNQLTSLDELRILKNKTLNSPTDIQRFRYLNECCKNENWEEFDKDPYLRIAHKRAMDELDRVNFLLDYDSRRGLIWSYLTGELSSDHHKLLDKYLSQETKSTIFKLTSEKDIIPEITRSVMNEVMTDCLYPTPHAVRHMWAEAVYRRFDGDAGWMIRSNFKHITQTMWLAYIRNKDNRRQHDYVKRQVVSSLLANYIRKKGVGYAGIMDKYLRRIFLSTHTKSIEQLDLIVEQFSLIEIEDIKSNPWGYCILRKRNQFQAKCSEQGIPQRHNASPSLCLTCTNNLVQVGNVDGILLGISNDLKVLQNSKVPESFHSVSFQTVKNAYKQLKNLDIDDESLKEIKAVLDFAKKDRYEHKYH